MSFEILLKHGKVIDGKGNPWFRGDVAIADGRIQAVESRIEGDAREELDVSRYVVCPGFIDAHTHSDYVFFIDPTAQSKVRQGVTTEVIGNCGMSGGPYFGGAREKVFAPEGFVPFWEFLPEYVEALAKQPKTVNLAPLIGHGTLRSALVGHEDRPPTQDELSRMKACLAQGLEAGAAGLSTGLYFAPGAFASQQELVELATVAARHGTVVTSHIRDEGSRSVGFIPAIREIVHLGREARAPIQISHIKAFGPDTWNTSGEVLRILEAARAEGIDVTCDQYPYDTTGGGLAADTLPYSFQSGKSPAQVSEALRKADVRDAVKGTIATNILKRGGPGVLTIATYPADPTLEGRTLQQICDSRRKDPADVVMDMLSDGYEAKWSCRSLSQQDVDAFLKYPATMIGSDGSSLSMEGPLSRGNPHPRNFGAFPRVINEYVRQRSVLSLEEAIRKMTSLPAQRFFLKDRGTLAEGMWADIVILDVDAVRDATFEHPKQYPTGIPGVMVNGKWVIKDNAFTGNLPGGLARRR
jgi:N-acyl-D-amino-acid deacylase